MCIISQVATSKFLKTFFKIALLIISIEITLVIIEVSTRVYIHTFPNSISQSQKDFRLSIPAPYKDSTYDVKHFVNQTFGKLEWYTPEETRLVIPKDFKNDYLSIKDELRDTSFQPEVYKNTIYVLGGSTVFCAEVPNDFTLPSQLQKMINEKYPNKYKVENYGSTSVVSSQELERLKTINLKKDDIVIFFDGGNDALQSIYNNDPEGYIIGKNKAVIKEVGKSQEFLIKLHTYLGPTSKFVYYFLDPFEYRYKPAHLSDEQVVKTAGENLENLYTQNIREAKKYADESDAHFFVFLQPTMYSGQTTTLYEKQLNFNNHIIAAGTKESLDIGYSYLYKALNNLKEDPEMKIYDLTKIFDEKKLEQDIFLDWVHVADKGNYHIAKNIFETIDLKTQEDLN